MSGIKKHLIADESLGGVLREFVEVERNADVGDYVHISRLTDEDVDHIAKVTETKHEICQFYFSPPVGRDDLLDYEFDEEYKTLEPTDIVVIDGKRYRMVERKAEVGEMVIVTNAENTFGKYDNGSVLVAEETGGKGIYNGDVATEECGGNHTGLIAHDEYRVLVLLEDVDESEASPSVVDMLSNLALRLTQLERKVNELADRQSFRHHEIESVHDRIDRLAHTCEQSDTQIARDVERIDAEVERLKHELSPKSDIKDLTVTRELGGKTNVRFSVEGLATTEGITKSLSEVLAHVLGK